MQTSDVNSTTNNRVINYRNINNIIKYKIAVISCCLVLIFIYFSCSSKPHLKLKGEDTLEVQNLQKKAEQGDVIALIELAQRYEDSLEYAYGLFSANTKPYYQKIFELYQKAAKQGNAEAEHKIAMMYYNGLGVAKDDIKGIEWDEKAARQDYLIAKLVLASVYSDDDTPSTIVDPKKSFYWYEQASQQGSTAADFSVGMSYYYGDGTNIDYKKALFYLMKSADGGSVNAQTALGDYYSNCKTGVCDNYQAKYWYQTAANNEEKIAQYNLGVFYELGLASEQDYTKAMYWYQRSEDRGNGQAALAVAKLYQQDKGVKQDYIQAKKHYETAIFYDQADGYYMLGLFYENGWGVTKDMIKANENFQEAFKYYQAFATHRNDIGAQYMLGILYMNGKGVEKDLSLARKWLKQAEDNGNEEAKEALLSLTEQ